MSDRNGSSLYQTGRDRRLLRVIVSRARRSVETLATQPLVHYAKRPFLFFESACRTALARRVDSHGSADVLESRRVRVRAAHTRVCELGVSQVGILEAHGLEHDARAVRI